MVPVYRTLFLALSALLLLGGQAHAVCNTTKLCEPGDNPCVISAACTINPGTTFDIRPRALVIEKPLTVDDTGVLTTTIRAGSITVEPSGDVIVSGISGPNGSGGGIRLFSDTTIEFRSANNTRSKLRAQGPNAGGSVVLSAVDDIVLDTTIDVSATNAFGIGGDVDINSVAGSVTIQDNGGGSSVRAAGGTSDFASGGLITVFAQEDVLIEGEIDASNGGFGGDIAVESFAGDVTTSSGGVIKVNASTIGDGGSVDIAADEGDVGLGGNVEAKGAGTGGEDGDSGAGGELTVSGNDVSITGSTITLTGAGTDSDGGFFEIDALGNVVMDSTILATGTGSFGSGGDISVLAEGSIHLMKKIDANAGGFGGFIDVTAIGDLTASHQILANGSAVDGGGGDIALQGCDVDVLSTAVLSANGDFGGSNLLVASGQMTIEGSLVAADGNFLRYRDLVPIVTGSVAPPATLFQQMNLPCCGTCPTTTTSTSVPTTSSTSTSSSTTSSSSSTSTAPAPTSSTSTSTSSSSTTMEAETTSTSTSVSTTSSTTSTSVSTTTSTVSTSTSSSTSSTLPLECYEQSLAPFDAVECRLGAIGGELNASTDEELGGRKAKRALTKRIAKADTLIALAQQFLADGKPEKKVLAKLRLAGRQLAAFEKKVRSGLDKGNLPAEAADFWLGLSTDASAQITLLSANVSGQ
jgi:hypothetical protein